MHYPSPKLRDCREPSHPGETTIEGDPIPLLKRVEPVVRPSQRRASIRDTSNTCLSDFNQHVCSLLEMHLPGASNGPHVVLQQLFHALRCSLVATMVQLNRRTSNMSSRHKLESTQPYMDRFIISLDNTVRVMRNSVQQQVELLEHISSQPAPQDVRTQTRWSELIFQYRHSLTGFTDLSSRASQLSQTRLVHVQIAESRRAIEQADGVRRLTTLAFIFIPLTYVASVFSANLSEMDGSRTAKIFVASSVLTTAAAILAALTVEQYLWPWTKKWVHRWRLHVYGVLADVDASEKTFNKFKSVIMWKTYHWGTWNLGDFRENWFLLPLATLDLGRLRIRQFLARMTTTSNKKKQDDASSA